MTRPRRAAYTWPSLVWPATLILITLLVCITYLIAAGRIPL